MTIVQGSRYASVPLSYVPVDAAGTTVKTVYGPTGSLPPRFTYYMIQIGERYDTIANRIYGRPDMWWLLADANPEVFYPDALVPGAIIRVPSP